MLEQKDIISILLEKSLNWDVLDSKKIRKEFIHNNFIEAMKFVNNVAELSERTKHHPDIHIYYNKVIIELWTHSEGGVTQKDIDLAAEINKIQLIK
jgi:4a-hydroxytetrahydrobiopterin dehydratase